MLVQSEVCHHPSPLDPVASMPLQSDGLSVVCLHQQLAMWRIGKDVPRHNAMAYDRGKNLDFCLSTIPKVGLYKKLGWLFFLLTSCWGLL